MKTAALFLAAPLLFGRVAPAQEAQGEVAALARPNIVFILADDLGWGDLGCYNERSRIPTPHLDRLAREGLRCTDAHSPAAVCSPTRYAILTGRYAWRTSLTSGVLWGESKLLIDPARTTVASLLKRAGYRTGAFGKWHLGFGEVEPVDYSKPLRPGPLELGFDEFFGIPASLDQTPYLYVRGAAPVDPPEVIVGGSDLRRRGGQGFRRAGPAARDFDHEAVFDRVIDEAVAFVQKWEEDRERPFFLYLALTAPHTPWLPTAPFRGVSRAGFYGDYVAQLDAGVGRVAQSLERLGLAKETLFVFTSDNGAHWTLEDIEAWNHRANGDLHGQKADIWEAGHRVPFLARYPGRIEAGATSDETICLVDLLATCAALARVELKEGEGGDSYDLSPVLFGEPYLKPLREATVHHSFAGHFAIRQGKWKLIPRRGSGGFTSPISYRAGPGEAKGQLYDLETDPYERHNLYADHPEVVKRLRELLRRYRQGERSVPEGD